MRRRNLLRGFSLVEVLVASLILAGVGLAIYDTLIVSTRGIAVDRVTEAKRRMVLDLLERLCHPYSDVDQYFVPTVKSPATRQLSLDEAMDVVAMPTDDRPLLKQILSSGHVIGFTLAWSRGLVVGVGKRDVLRLDKLWVYPVANQVERGPTIGSFRMFYVRP